MRTKAEMMQVKPALAMTTTPEKAVTQVVAKKLALAKTLLLAMMVALALGMAACGSAQVSGAASQEAQSSASSSVAPSEASSEAAASASSASSATEESPTAENVAQGPGTAQEAARTNPESVDAAHAGAIKLTGTVERVNEPRSQTMMAWGCVTYLLKLPEPVAITFNSADGMTTETVGSVQIVSVEYSATADDAQQQRLADHPEEAQAEYDRYVGAEVVVSGGVLNTGNAHSRASCVFSSPTIEPL